MTERLLTRQEVLNHVHAHFTAPDARLGVSTTPGCVRSCCYRTLDGARCAVGALLTADELDKLDWVREGRVLGEISVDDLPERLRSDELHFLLDDLQTEHDASDTVEEFRTRLNRYAADVGLNVPS